MATASPQVWLEEEMICSICLQIYTDPVILNCKHSFCQVCIKKTWDEAVFDAYPCPECRAEYRKRPILQKNFKLASIIQKCKAQDPSICLLSCTSKPHPAVKTCLKCESSMCPVHLGNSTNSTADMSLWKCTEHQEPLKIYCKDDKVCVCTLCTLIGKHKGHNCGSINEGEKELRTSFNNRTEKIRNNIEVVQVTLRDLQKEKLKTQDEIKQKKIKIKEKSDALKKRIESEEREIFDYLDREEKHVIAEIDAQIQDLNGKMSDFKKYLTNLNNVSKKKEIFFIQMFNSEAGRLRSLSKPFVSLPSPCLDATKLQQLAHWSQEQVERNRDILVLLYGQTPILDPNTAHPQLVVSLSKRNVTLTRQKRKYPDNPGRFDCFPQVMCAEGMNCGLAYWEVEVPGGCWRVGVCYKSLSRKGPGAKCSLGMNDKSWSLCSVLGSYTALHNGNKMKITAENPSRVGVYVDFEAGIISFYSVSDRKLTLLYSFQQQTFIEALYPALTVNECDDCITICDLSFTFS
ncbi:tripartite motif-containing protein 60-like [Carcharodon carcharias]|uniref:tripartite motif-containing protein 60-like n=1 Tax=Carcharodon carcharias TaxID=13397 RepID=UPI001B7F7533|nr:tripartite motif-containing protein 60-like [Carcharodon carcharias]